MLADVDAVVGLRVKNVHFSHVCKENNTTIFP